jgi:superfamily I DNA and/or RNA helicase
VVVGDRMQLPPTRFFASGGDGVDTVIEATIDATIDEAAADAADAVVDADGHRLTITLDADSFLTQADLALPSTMLTWHYRSRSESLIAYSNHAFYAARLATVPDRDRDDDERPDIVIASPSDARTHVAALADRPISFHRVRHGVYEHRRNDAEADYIAELVRALLVGAAAQPDRPSPTVGIVAFSEAQQTAIEGALAELATVDPAFATLLEGEQARVDDGEFVGLFVKNLENVQGDERDVIIMSVCYAPGPDGRMRMHFGPINQAGGERRLNVIFSRAKRHMAIVSTIDATAITNTYNDGAAHLARFLAYAEAESRGGAGGEPVLRGLHADAPASGADARRSAVAAEIAEALSARGAHVDTAVGRSGFRIDVAVRGTDGYRLGVVVDPGRDDATAMTRVVAEAGVLRAFGWDVTRVLVTEWWNDPAAVTDRLVRAAG